MLCRNYALFGQYFLKIDIILSNIRHYLCNFGRHFLSNFQITGLIIIRMIFQNRLYRYLYSHDFLPNLMAQKTQYSISLFWFWYLLHTSGFCTQIQYYVHHTNLGNYKIFTVLSETSPSTTFFRYPLHFHNFRSKLNLR